MKLYIVTIIAAFLFSSTIQAQDTMSQPVNVGSKTSSFTYTDTKNTVNFSNDYGQSSNDVFYKFTLTRAMDVKISHCDSELGDTYVHLLDANGNLIAENDDDWEYEYCSNPMNSFLYMTGLPAGTYYVVSEGYSQNGNITTTIEGISPMDVYSQDIGSKASSFTFTDTKNTINSANNYTGQESNDVFYKFTLTRPMDVYISHCGSALQDTYLHLLGESGNLIDENDDDYEYDFCEGSILNSFLLMPNLNAGTYYVVSEGYGEDNGNITTTIQGVRPYSSTSQNAGLDPSTDQNYILTITPTEATSDVSTLSADQSIQTLQYFDGLGRPVQTVQRKITPQRKDMVSTVEYDGVGRDYLQWLPTPVADNQGAFVKLNDISNLARNVHADSRPFNETIFESSPLNRVIGQKGSGAAWNTHPGNMSYQTNTAAEVAYYYVNSNNQLQRDANGYTANTLFKTVVADPDTKTTTEYKNKEGQVIMKRSSSNIDTYYVYNDLGQLSYVIPAIAADNLTAQTPYTDDNIILKQYCYLYKYDERGNCIQKRLPGCDWINMVYDKADRLILSQDGNQRLKKQQDKKQWTITKYDVLGRVIMTGLTYIDSLKTHLNLNTDYKTQLITETYTNGEYSVQFFPTATALTINYYDDYNFLSLVTNGSSLQYVTPPSGYGTRYNSYKGLLTGTRTYILDGSNNYTSSADYYDYRGRVIQTRSTNHLTGFDIAYNAYDFSGHIINTKKTHDITGQTPIDELYTYFYDHAGRPTITKYKIDAKDEITLSSNSYDEMGRLTTKTRHTGADTETYNYNIRNWTTKIASGEFEENLYYNSNPVGNTACFNGNISYSTWTYGGVSKGYAYTYDALNRLLDATSKQGTSTQGNGYFNEKFTYDNHGNIKTLKRWKDNVLIDDLAMHYRFNEQSNQLDWIADSGINQNLYSVKEYQNKSTATSNEFSYDVNGNMTKDLDRDIVTIKYNVLNLPDIIQFKYGNQIRNLYDAGGHKLKAEYYTNNDPLLQPLNPGEIHNFIVDPSGNQSYDFSGTAYIDNFEYTNESPTTDYQLDKVYNPEGYAMYPTSTSVQYNYYRKDHLGDNREVWRAAYRRRLPNGSSTTVAAATVQQTQYYPSGLPWAEGIGQDVQHRKYNGKEFIEMHGYDTYDYGARGMYAAIGRFSTPDPLCEMKPWQSPYMYCSGNPVNRIDPTGLADILPEGKVVCTAPRLDKNKSNSSSPSVKFIDTNMNKPNITPPMPSFNMPTNPNNVVKNNKDSKSEKDKNEELLNTLNMFLATIAINLETKELITKYVLDAAKIGKGAEALGKVCTAFGKMSPWLTGGIAIAKILNDPSTKNIIAGIGNTGMSLMGPEISWVSSVGDLTGVSDKTYTKIGNYVNYGAYNSYVNFNQNIQNIVYSLILGQ